MFRLLFNKIEELYIKINEMRTIISLGTITNAVDERDLLYLQKVKAVINKIEEKLQSLTYRLFVRDKELDRLIKLLEEYHKQITDLNNKCPMCTNKFGFRSKDNRNFN